jgi:transcriptional regulator with XRE-family HTH domain
MIDCKLAETFRTNVKAHRERLNLTQTEFSNLLGVQRSKLADLERGRNIPSLRVVETVANALHVDASSLLSESSSIKKVSKLA